MSNFNSKFRFMKFLYLTLEILQAKVKSLKSETLIRLLALKKVSSYKTNFSKN